MMNKKLSSLFLVASLICAASASALDETDKRYIDRLAKGGPDSLREVGEGLTGSHSTNTEVLDVAAEVLLEKYKQAADRDSADALAWLCRALGGSGNNRYKAAIDEVANKAENRKLRGYCEKASKSLLKGATESFTAGTVNLEKLRNATPEKTAKGAAPAAKPAGGPKTVDFSLVRVGMGSAEVIDILGQPTAQTQHMTGKQFQPFNFGARDLQRMYFLYKGVGRIELSLKSAYEGVYRVIKIVPNPDESGYP
jgi:hypothetical protein